MRIAQVVCIYPPERGGIGQVASDYSEGLREAGHDVTIFHSGGDRLVLRVGNARLFPSLLWKLRKFDLIHLHYPFYGAQFFTAVASRFFKVPLVITFHMRATGVGIKGRIFEVNRWLLEKWIFKTAKRIFVSSTDYATTQGVVHPNLVELPFFVDETLYLHDESAGAENPTVLFVGGMDSAHYFKGIPTLLKAFSLVFVKGARLELIGDGNLRPRFEALAKRFGIADRVSFLGAVSDEEKAKAYRRAWLHVLPSTTTAEAFGIVTVEAAMSGTASIVSNLPGVRTVVEHGVTGVIAPVDDPDALAVLLNEMLAHPENLAILGQNARARALSLYSRPVLLKRLESCYNEVI